MTRSILLVIISCLILSCNKDNENKHALDLNLLEGEWLMESQTIDFTPVDFYTNIVSAWDDGTLLWTDTIHFGPVAFHFASFSETEVVNEFFLESENFRKLYGSWSMNASKDSIIIRSLVNEYMNQDTVISGHRYAFHMFVNFRYNVAALTDTRLVLENHGSRLEFSRN